MGGAGTSEVEEGGAGYEGKRDWSRFECREEKGSVGYGSRVCTKLGNERKKGRMEKKRNISDWLSVTLYYAPYFLAFLVLFLLSFQIPILLTHLSSSSSHSFLFHPVPPIPTHFLSSGRSFLLQISIKLLPFHSLSSTPLLISRCLT